MRAARKERGGDYAKEKDFRRFVREIRDLFHAGFPEVARERARIVKEVLDENEHQLNPHRGWREDVRWAFAETLEGD